MLVLHLRCLGNNKPALLEWILLSALSLMVNRAGHIWITDLNSWLTTWHYPCKNLNHTNCKAGIFALNTELKLGELKFKNICFMFDLIIKWAILTTNIHLVCAKCDYNVHGRFQGFLNTSRNGHCICQIVIKTRNRSLADQCVFSRICWL